MTQGRPRTRLLTALGLLAACSAGIVGLPPEALAADPPTTVPAATPATGPAMPHEHTNRLAKERSPYLLQHAHNPVDWYPWGEEAFARARKENKPILLSVGYSTCHWCHVMERESFESEAIAAVINAHFVPVKVDREERPDVDRVYMTFVQATTGSGGWPMTVFLTPDLKPFYGGTYYPPEARNGMPGFKDVLAKIHEVWRDDRQKVLGSADKLTDVLRKATAAQEAKGTVSPLLLKATLGQLEASFDRKWGGFGEAPKFPEPPTLQFLLHYAHTAPDEKARQSAREMVLKTLDGMAAGGVYDHLGGGFHRYSVDERWFLPHFEKMLYDQAQLAAVYADGWRVTKDARHAEVARGVLDYVLRDLTGPDGQFYCAEDADSARDPAKPKEKAEGAFYVWSADELQRVLGAEPAKLFASHFGVKPTGNVAQDPHHEFERQNVLFRAEPLDVFAKHVGKSPDEVTAALAPAKGKLLAVRVKRPRPHLDDKTLTAWSGLMISGFAKAGSALEEPKYIDAAVRSAAFVRGRLYDAKAQTLIRRFRDNHAEVGGFLEDYAYLIQGLLDLYESTLDHQWLAWAGELQAKQDQLFWDETNGGYYSTAEGDKSLLLRMKDDADGAEPSGNSVAVMNLLRLGQMADDAKLTERANRTLAAFAGRMRASPLALPYMEVAADFAAAKPRQIVIAGDPASPETKRLLAEVHKRYLPNRVVLSADGGAGQAWLGQKLPFLKEMKPINGRPAAYVCQNYACQQPTTDPAELGRQLK